MELFAAVQVLDESLTAGALLVFVAVDIAETELRGASLDDLRRNICASIACRADFSSRSPTLPRTVS